MRRTLILILGLAGLIAPLHGWRALTDAPVAQAAVPAADPVERDRLISVFERRVAVPDPEPLNLSVLGRLYLERGWSEKSLDDYIQARDALLLATKTLDDPATLLNLADSHLALHEFGAARQIASKLVSTDPADRALATLADAELALGDYPAALQALQPLARRLPDEPSILVRLAQYHFLTGDIDQAQDLGKRAAHVAVAARLSLPDQAFYLMFAGRMSFEAGDYRGARAHLHRAIETDSRAPGPLFELGKVMAAEGQLPEAIRLIEAAVALVPEPTSLSWLGDLYFASGDSTAGAAQYDTIGAIALLDQSAYRLSVAAAMANSGWNPIQALELAAAELSVRTDPTTWHVYAVALYETGAYEKAYRAIQNAFGPADARLWFHAGVIAAATGRQSEAIRHLKAALAANPEFHPLDAARARELLAELSL